MKQILCRSILFAHAVSFVIACDSGVCMASAAEADSSRFFHWSSVYTAKMLLNRADGRFPWNASGSDSLFADRVSAGIHAGAGGGLDLFLKIGSGLGGRATGRRSDGLFLEQGHIRFEPGNLPLETVIFIRERMFAPHTRLLPVISDDSPILPEAAEGAKIAVKNVRNLSITYIRCALRERGIIEKHGGLPVFEEEGDRLDFLECSARSGFGHIGLSMSAARSSLYGNSAIVGTEGSFRIGSLDFSAGFARSVDGGLEEIEASRIFDIDPSKIRIGKTAAAFAPETAVAAEVRGIEFSQGNSGKFGLIPSYRYYGRDFSDPQGEIRGGLVESRATAFWKHPKLAVMAVIDCVDRFSMEEKRDGAALAGYVRTRFRGGFETSEGIMLRDDGGPSMAVSMLDESERVTMSVTARLDNRGNERDLSFLAEGGLKAGSSWLIRNCVFLERSAESYYNIALEFRPGRRFLFTVSAGSFRPWAESVMLMDEPGCFNVRKDRFISISTRVWMGGF